ncbi:MAG: Fe-S protein assembly co-chaperone HscB [Gammaproteobacteria bacterium]|nr:Fe-S protein assembly co-chaperone HscB [Gammaproteobacteria bacterium]
MTKLSTSSDSTDSPDSPTMADDAAATVAENTAAAVAENAASTGAEDAAALESYDYFSLFSLQAGFDIDEARLHRAWLVRQREFHPDRHLNLPLPQRAHVIEAATTATAEINFAYQTLKEPLSRAVYLLSLKSCAVDEQETIDDPEFLGQMMEARMQLGDIADKNDEQLLSDHLASLEDTRRDYYDKLRQLFADTAYADGETTHLARIKRCVNELKFYLRLLEQGRAQLYQMQ